MAKCQPDFKTHFFVTFTELPFPFVLVSLASHKLMILISILPRNKSFKINVLVKSKLIFMIPIC